MKKIILFFTILLPLFCGFDADAQGWQWGRGSDGPGLNEGYFCATDGAGSVYGAGYQSFSNSFGTYSIAGTASYVVKYDSVGTLKWAIGTVSAASTSGIFGMTTDQFGNEYLLGIHTHMLSFGSYTIYDPGPIAGYYFMAKIDSLGNVQWLENIGDLHGTVIVPGGNCLATDDLGNVYVTCPYTGNATIDGHVLDSAGYGDVFVGKFDPSGTAIWVKDYKMVPLGGAITSGIAVTPTHKLYISGYFNTDSLIFGTHVLVDTGNHVNNTGYLAKLDSNGNPLWAKGTGGSNGNDEFTGVATNLNEDVYVTGLYASCVLHIGSDSLPQPWYAGYGFLAKYDSLGNVAWLKLMQGKYVAAWAPAVDSGGNVWVSATLGYEPCTDTIDGHLLSSALTIDPMFVAGWTSSGLYIEGATLASGGDDQSGIALDKSGNIFIEGDYEIDMFNVGPDTLHLSTTQEMNLVAKYKNHMGGPIGAITGDSILCKGDTLTLNEATTGGTWSSSNIIVAIVGSSTGLVTGAATGIAEITYTAGSGFVTMTVTVTIPPSPIVGPTDLCLGITDLSDATPDGFWSTSNSSVATVGPTNGIVTGVSTGAVTITYAISAGCYVTATDTVLGCVAGVSVVPTNNDKIELFPNPATNLLTIASAGQIASVIISNPLGQVVYSLQLAGGSLQTSVDVSTLPSGVYFVKINGPSPGSGQAVVRKLVKE